MALTEKKALEDNPKISLHLKCFNEIMLVRRKIEIATEYLEGKLPFNAANGVKVGRDTIEETLKAIDDFDKRMNMIENRRRRK
jgi:hypothetical protein